MERTNEGINERLNEFQIKMAHRLFVGRTMPVLNKSAEATLNALSGSMKQHGLTTKIKLARRYEKPTKERVRKEVRLIGGFLRRLLTRGAALSTERAVYPSVPARCC